jgi:hypothetical protein
VDPADLVEKVETSLLPCTPDLSGRSFIPSPEGQVALAGNKVTAGLLEYPVRAESEEEEPVTPTVHRQAQVMEPPESSEATWDSDLLAIPASPDLIFAPVGVSSLD